MPDELWEIVQPLLPACATRSQGGGTAPVDERAVFTAVCTCSRRGVPGGTCRRTSGCRRPRHTGGSPPGPARGCGDGCIGRCWIAWAPTGPSTGRPRSSTPPLCGRTGGSLTGANPVDRGKAGATLHVLTDAAGLPLVVGVSAANTHDSQALQPLVRATPAIRSCRGPRRRRPATLHPDKGYDYPHLRTWLRDRRITPASPAAASTPPNASAATDGRSNAPSPGSPATAASPPATNAKAPSTALSPPSPPPSPATSDSPRETSS